MEFLPAELIRKKREGLAHTREELRYLIQEYAQEKLPDYQMAAWLMAVCFRGMTADETAWFTQEMRDSGEVLDLKDLGVSVDKHSTGGLGDKTSLLLAPIVAAAGIPVPMMAGRGLAHTGGTLDKLEAISGFNVRLDLKHFRQQIKTIGAAIIGQTTEICPADRKLYALRDVTGTVDSLPLICGSIMSKKLAEGMSALVLDVKVGSGAFMKTPEQAEALARALKDIGERSGKKVVALLTRMDEPLGRYTGNALEVKEVLEILGGQSGPNDALKSYEDTIELTLELAAHMIALGGKARDVNEGRAKASEILKSGLAMEKFEAICRAQGGDLKKSLPQASVVETVASDKDGVFRFTNVEKLGMAAIHLGAGRKFQSDRLDHATGIEVLRVNGEKIRAGDPLFKIHANQKKSIQDAATDLKKAYEISDSSSPRSPLILKVLK